MQVCASFCDDKLSTIITRTFFVEISTLATAAHIILKSELWNVSVFGKRQNGDSDANVARSLEWIISSLHLQYLSGRISVLRFTENAHAVVRLVRLYSSPVTLTAGQRLAQIQPEAPRCVSPTFDLRHFRRESPCKQSNCGRHRSTREFREAMSGV